MSAPLLLRSSIRRAEGDAAVIALTNKFDRRNASSMAELALDQETIAAAYARIDDDLRDALETAAARIKAFMKAAAAGHRLSG